MTKSLSSPIHSRLDWTDFKESDLPEVDVVVGSDLVYSPDLIPGLAKVISSLLSKSRDSEAAAYIACTQRTRFRVVRILEFRSFKEIPLSSLLMLLYYGP